MKILLVEDDLETRAVVCEALRALGHQVDEKGDGQEGLSQARGGDYAALIVDRMLPELDGLSLVRSLRQEGNEVPVLFLTTMSGLDDRVTALEAGGDDYLVKPFAMRELIARVHTVGQRAGRATVLRAGDIEMELFGRQVRREGTVIDLLEQEFRLLEYLMRNAGQVVTRTMLLENVWNLHFDPRTNVVQTHISRLRSKIDRGFERQYLQTVHGIGYVLCTD